MDKATEQFLLDLVKRNYEEIAADFDITRKKYLWPELVKLAGQVQDGDSVLDVGCGNGRLVEAFGEKKISYLGVDSSEKLIEAARNNFQFSNKFQVGDILEPDKLPEKDFNYIFCIAVLHHLPGDDLRLRALEQMKNKLKPNGKIVITVWNLWSQAKFRKLIFKFGWLKLMGKNKMDFGDILFDWKNNKSQAVSRRYYHAFTKRELNKIVGRAGLKIEKLYQDRHNYYLILKIFT